MLRFLIPLATAIVIICLLTGAAGAALVFIVADGYFIWLKVHPLRKCISCRGSKEHGFRGSANRRRCLTCGGQGEYARLGVKLLDRGVAEQIKAGKHGGLH